MDASVKLVYEMVLSVPGMSETIKKMDFSMSRRTLLLLCQILQAALQKPASESDMLSIAAPESIEELKLNIQQWLQKADLVELNEKLKSLPG